jgi:hypothetical protein
MSTKLWESSELSKQELALLEEIELEHYAQWQNQMLWDSLAADDQELLCHNFHGED